MHQRQEIFSPILDKAIELASSWHDGTYRKGKWRVPISEDLSPNVPVMSHLMNVALLLQRADWDDHTVAAGILHDILEDSNKQGLCFPYAKLAQEMGHEIATLVQGVSEIKTDATGNKRSWQLRKEDYLRHLAETNEATIAISLADKIHNLWTMNQSLKQGINIFSSSKTRQGLSAGPEQQRWYFKSVYEIAEQRTHPKLTPLVETLEKEILEFETLIEAL